MHQATNPAMHQATNPAMYQATNPAMYQATNSAPRFRLIFLLLVLAGVVSSFVGSTRGPLSEKALAKVTSEINQKLPRMVDPETRLDQIVTGPGKSIVYRYTLVNFAKGEVPDPSRIAKVVRPKVLDRYRSDKDLKRVRESGLVLHHKYFDKYGTFLAGFQVGPADLRR